MEIETPPTPSYSFLDKFRESKEFVPGKRNYPPPNLAPPEMEDITHFSIEVRWGKVNDLRFLEKDREQSLQSGDEDPMTKLLKKTPSGYYTLKDAHNYVFTLQTDDSKKGWIDIYCGSGRKFFYDNLKCNTAYKFRVRALSELDYGDWSDVVTFVTDVEPTTGYDIHRAIRFEDVKLLKVLLEKNKPSILNVPNKIGHMPLMVAALRTMDEIVQLLIDHGADVNAANDSGKTCMMLAAFAGNLRMVELLHKNGALLNVQDKSGCSVLHAAVDGGYPEMVEWVVQQGGDIHMRDNIKGWTPLLRTAAISGNAVIAKILLKAGANINDKDVDGKTALMIAACNNYSYFVEELLKHGADPKQKSRYGKTALDMAVALGRKSTTELLTSHLISKDGIVTGNK